MEDRWLIRKYKVLEVSFIALHLEQVSLVGQLALQYLAVVRNVCHDCLEAIITWRLFGVLEGSHHLTFSFSSNGQTEAHDCLVTRMSLTTYNAWTKKQSKELKGQSLSINCGRTTEWKEDLHGSGLVAFFPMALVILEYCLFRVTFIRAMLWVSCSSAIFASWICSGL